MHPRLAAYLIDLSMFRVKWIVDKSFFQFTQGWVSLDGLVEPLPPAKFKGMGKLYRSWWWCTGMWCCDDLSMPQLSIE